MIMSQISMGQYYALNRRYGTGPEKGDRAGNRVAVHAHLGTDKLIKPNNLPDEVCVFVPQSQQRKSNRFAFALGSAGHAREREVMNAMNGVILRNPEPQSMRKSRPH